MVVVPEGINDFQILFGNPDFEATGVPFHRWMEANHPEDAEMTNCCAGDTAEESVVRGELRAQYAQDWAAYLEANDCNFRLSC